MTLQLPAVENHGEIRWMSPASGLWVATRRGDHAGMVERLDGRYHARSARGRALGTFDDLDSARAVIDRGAEARPGAPRGLAVALWAINGVAVVAALGLAVALIR